MGLKREKMGDLTGGEHIDPGGQWPVVSGQLSVAAPVSTISPPWRNAGLRYYAYNFFLRNKFGGRVQKVSIDAGFTCPNVDGTVAKGGCTFCDNRSFSPSRRSPRMSPRDVQGQIAEGIRRLKWRYDVEKFIAYFQPATNTYAPVEKLRPLYEAAIRSPRRRRPGYRHSARLRAGRRARFARRACRAKPIFPSSMDCRRFTIGRSIG